jgi:hypothetical protein
MVRSSLKNYHDLQLPVCTFVDTLLMHSSQIEQTAVQRNGMSVGPRLNVALTVGGDLKLLRNGCFVHSSVRLFNRPPHLQHTTTHINTSFPPVVLGLLLEDKRAEVVKEIHPVRTAPGEKQGASGS